MNEARTRVLPGRIVQRRQAGQKDRPTAPFLICINGLLFFTITAIGSNQLGQILALVATVFFMTFCLLWHGVVSLTERRYHYHPLLRIALFLAPVLLLLILPWLGLRPEQRVNQTSPLLSPSGRFELTVRSRDYWDLRIRDLQTGERHVEETDFVGHFNIYWQWDAADRLWVYNSDDGSIHIREWNEGRWDLSERDREPSAHDPAPPENFLPHYAQERM
jgi:hypothetical protein